MGYFIILSILIMINLKNLDELYPKKKKKKKILIIIPINIIYLFTKKHAFVLELGKKDNTLCLVKQ